MMRQTSPVLRILLLVLLSACIARGQGNPAAGTLQHVIWQLCVGVGKTWYRNRRFLQGCQVGGSRSIGR